MAENNLGLMSARGQGTKPDLGQAMRLFEKSAEKGWPPAQANLAYMYTTDPSKDLVRAYMWCTLALAGGAGRMQENDSRNTGPNECGRYRESNQQGFSVVPESNG